MVGILVHRGHGRSRGMRGDVGLGLVFCWWFAFGLERDRCAAAQCRVPATGVWTIQVHLAASACFCPGRQAPAVVGLCLQRDPERFDSLNFSSHHDAARGLINAQLLRGTVDLSTGSLTPVISSLR